jgi:ketosteroid isomerase-like protein
MSQQSVEVVQRWVWAFEHDTDTFLALAHPELEWAPFEENHTVFRGVEGAIQIRDGWLDAWAEHRIDIEEMIDRGDDIIVVLHITGRGKASGLEVDVRLYVHVKVRDGKVAYLFEHEDRARALDAVGLTE